MAHPLPVGSTVNGGVRVLDRRPAFAQLIATIANGWSLLDHEIAAAYALLMNQGPHVEGFSPGLDPVALQVFDTIDTQQKRIELLTKLAGWRVKDEHLLKDLTDRIVPAIRRAAKLRNTVMHSVWGVCEDYPDAIIQLPAFGHQMIYEIRDFEDAVGRIESARQLLTSFYLSFARTRKPTHRLVGDTLVPIDREL